MALINELNARKKELLDAMQDIDREAAKIREEYEDSLSGLRAKRIPLEERVRIIDTLIKSEGGA